MRIKPSVCLLQRCLTHHLQRETTTTVINYQGGKRSRCVRGEGTKLVATP